MTVPILVAFSAVLYFLSFAVSAFAKQNRSRLKLSSIFAFAGFASQTAAIAVRGFFVGGIALSTSYDLLEFITWGFVLIQLAGAVFFKTGLVGIFSILPAAILTALPLGCPMYAETMQNIQRASTGASTIHAILAVISYAFMIAGAVAAAMYLAQEKYLREKSHSLSARILPSLQRLDGTMKVSLQTALFSMAVSSILGAIIASQTSIDLPMFIKLSGGAVILAAQAAVFAAAAAKKLGSKKLAICEIALSILALLMLILIELRTALVK